VEQNQTETAAALTESTEATKTEFTNENVTVKVKRKPACTVELDVTATPKLVQFARKNAVKAVAKEVTIPGFRKGKAPDEFILKNYASHVDKKWQDLIANYSFGEAEKITRIPLLSKETRVIFNMISHSYKEGAALTLTFETEPEVPYITTQTIELKAVKRPEVTQEKVKETIRQTQLFFAHWKEITDRPVQEGDFILLNVDIIEDTPPTSLFSHTRFEVTDKSMAKWMKDLVLGLNTGASVEGVSTPDKDVAEEDKKDYQDKKVRLTLLAIESAEVPPLTDEFAKQLGVESVEVLNTRVEELLNKQADAHVQEKLREQAGDYLLENYTIELPASLTEKEARFRLQQLMQDPEFKAHFESLSKEEKEKTVTSLTEQSKKAVRMFYLCRGLVTQARLKITTADLHKAASTPLEALLLPQSYNQPEEGELQQAEAISKILLEKAEDYIVSHAIIK